MEHNHHKTELSLEEIELYSWKKKLMGAWIFTIPIAIIMLVERFFEINIFMFAGEMAMIYVLMIIAFPVVFYFGFDTIKAGMRGLFTFYFNMDSLIALGTVVAYLTGIGAIFGIMQDFSGVSAMIMAFFISGKYVEVKARGKASKEIKKLLELGAKEAIILREGVEVRIPISEVKIGDVMIIKPGEKIPCDGIVVKGESSVNESMISGESFPKEKSKGSNVIGATINNDGILYVKATKIGKDTFLAHIIELVEDAQGTKVPIQKMADKITSIFVPAILILAFLSFLLWYFLTSDVSKSLEVFVSVLVIACPCALGLATPTALMVGSGMGAKRGILIRKGEAIQTMKEVKVIAFDKTGTITKGNGEVSNYYILPNSKLNEKTFFELASSLEVLSEHPIAKAIVKKADELGIKKYKKINNFKTLRGKGLSGSIGKNAIIIGNVTLMNEKKIKLNVVRTKIDEYENDGKTTMVVYFGGKIIGLIAVSDEIKEDSIHAIRILNLKGYKTIMITGDNEKTAQVIAKKVGIKEVISNVLPEDKVKKIEMMQKQNKGLVAFVGDGINDAPALKAANVGVAIGSGSDIAIEAGDIVLAKSSLIGVVQAINLSKLTFSKIKQNLFWAFAYNTIAIPLAVGGVLHPVIAEIAMALSSISVVTNANLLRKKKI